MYTDGQEKLKNNSNISSRWLDPNIDSYKATNKTNTHGGSSPGYLTLPKAIQ